MRAALAGVLLVNAGYFALMLAGPSWWSAVGRVLIAMSFIPLGYYGTSGVNRMIWSLRDTLDERGKRKLWQLRAFAVLCIALLIAAIATAFGAGALGSSLGTLTRNTVVVAAFATSLGAIAGGAWIRASEYRLFKDAWERLSKA